MDRLTVNLVLFAALLSWPFCHNFMSASVEIIVLLSFVYRPCAPLMGSSRVILQIFVTYFQ